MARVMPVCEWAEDTERAGARLECDWSDTVSIRIQLPPQTVHDFGRATPVTMCTTNAVPLADVVNVVIADDVPLQPEPTPVRASVAPLTHLQKGRSSCIRSAAGVGM